MLCGQRSLANPFIAYLTIQPKRNNMISTRGITHKNLACGQENSQDAFLCLLFPGLEDALKGAVPIETPRKVGRWLPFQQMAAHPPCEDAIIWMRRLSFIDFICFVPQRRIELQTSKFAFFLPCPDVLPHPSNQPSSPSATPPNCL